MVVVWVAALSCRCWRPAHWQQHCWLCCRYCDDDLSAVVGVAGVEAVASCWRLMHCLSLLLT